MKSNFLICTVATVVSVFSTQVFAAEYEQIDGGPVQTFTQKNGENVYTIFKFSLSGGITKSNSTIKALAAGTTFTSECVGYSKTEKGISSVESHCTSTDSDGATSSASSTRVGAVGQTSNGKQFLEILTGPNAGVKSECSFVPKYSKTSEGTYLIVTSKCTTPQ
jgi:hypothetical protein